MIDVTIPIITKKPIELISEEEFYRQYYYGRGDWEFFYGNYIKEYSAYSVHTYSTCIHRKKGIEIRKLKIKSYPLGEIKDENSVFLINCAEHWKMNIPWHFLILNHNEKVKSLNSLITGLVKYYTKNIKKSDENYSHALNDIYYNKKRW